MAVMAKHEKSPLKSWPEGRSFKGDFYSGRDNGDRSVLEVALRPFVADDRFCTLNNL